MALEKVDFQVQIQLMCVGFVGGLLGFFGFCFVFCLSALVFKYLVFPICA